MPVFTTTNSLSTNLDDIHASTLQARASAIHLLNQLQGIYDTKKVHHQIATSESLTAGLIMSTLVDIPYGGWYKYGGFIVYDTDAKRVFNGVAVEDVYTSQCAKEMAVGVLKNSNCSIALSVTGNAKPPQHHEDTLGEVYIGVAGYLDEHTIIYDTKKINGCEMGILMEKCDAWKHASKRTFKDPPAEFYLTFEMSTLLRIITVREALNFCSEFVEQFKGVLVTPSYILELDAKRPDESPLSRRRLNPMPSKFKEEPAVFSINSSTIQKKLRRMIPPTPIKTPRTSTNPIKPLERSRSIRRRQNKGTVVKSVVNDVVSSIKIPIGPSATRRRNGRYKALSTIAESLVSSRS